MPPAPAAADFRALGTGVRVLATDARALPAAVAAVERELAAIDAACSRFRADSELTHLNLTAGSGPLAASPVLLDALEAALRTARITDGAVDPTVGQALEHLGYDRDFALVVRSDRSVELLERPAAGWRRVQIDRERGLASLPAGVQLDLGASAKALAADRAAAAAARECGAGVLVSLGGDIAVAGDAPGDGWSVLVAEDHAAPLDGCGQVVALRQGGLATSSTTVRRWTRAGIELHHILDPRTGLPAGSCWRTVSAVAPTCTEANAYATAAIVWGAAAVQRLARAGVPARLVGGDGELVKVGAWPADGERP
jgi:thiamine biosynthesis lipoprotein ApbE